MDRRYPPPRLKHWVKYHRARCCYRRYAVVSRLPSMAWPAFYTATCGGWFTP